MATAIISVQEVLIKQRELGDGLKIKYEQYNNLPIERKKRKFVQAKLDNINQEFELFKANHQVLLNAGESIETKEYFNNKYYEYKSSKYEAFAKELVALLEVLGPELIEEDPSGFGAAFNQDKGSGSTVNLEDLFKAAETQNRTQLQNPTLAGVAQLQAFNQLMQSLTEAMDVHNMNDGPSDDEKAVIRALIIKKWEDIQILHQELMGKGGYQMQEYFQMENKMLPILIKEHLERKNEGRHRDTVVWNQQSAAKIPKLTIPKCKGDVVEWRSFKELFMKMVGNKAGLDGAEKLAYLKGQLEGEPLRMIASLPLIAVSYDTAWNLLNGRFENQHVITTKLLDKIAKGEQIKKYSSQSMKEVLDVIRESVSTLVNLGFEMNDTMNYILYYLVEKRIDLPTISLYENTLQAPGNNRRYDDLMKFLEIRVQNLSSKSEPQPNNHAKITKSKKVGFKNVYYEKDDKKASTALIVAANSQSKRAANTAPSCGCEDSHSIYKCPKFEAMSPEERLKKSKEWKLCVNCLKKGHINKECKSRGCRKCNKKHNSLLHSETADALIGAVVENEKFNHIFLATVIVIIPNKDGKPIKARALLDSGSQLNFMTTKLCKKLGLDQSAASMKIRGIGNVHTESTKRVTIKIKSRASAFETFLEMFVLKQVTSCQPAKKVDIENWRIPKNIELADPEFNIPATVDIVIGGELFFKLISIGEISIGENLPDLQNTVFGWIVTGKVLGLQQNTAFVGITTGEELDNQVQKFWQIEEKYQDEKPKTQLERNCERHFEETTMREIGSGKFIVQLQFIKEPSTLGRSEQMAIRRFLQLEKRFINDPILHNDYLHFMKEYESLGHMKQIKRESIGNKNYFIPHHGVRNPGSSTTKFRVVFDASAKTTSNVSLNDILANGPMIQEDLFSIMARFRTHQYVFSADITKMYRQIMINKNHRNWQLIVWRESKDQPLKYYQLQTVTYGTTCASYLAIKTLQTLADENKKEFPIASVVAKRDFNVDDVMTGSNDLYEAIIMQKQLINLCEKGNFHLHKWCANHPALLEGIPKTKQEVSLDFSSEKTETKALGMKWIPKEDIFMLSYNPIEHKKVTKRTVLSEAAQLFDPLGIVNPVIVLAKIFLQELWALKLDWDEALPKALHTKWISFREELKILNEVKISRKMIIENATNIQLHAFSDSSTRAYGAVFYLRSENKDGKVQVRLVCSKSRVAPVSTTTLPRLELCAAVVASEMANKLNRILGIEIASTDYWTDSELVLSWIYNEASFKTFVANRVASIKRKTKVEEWKYINTKMNPADLISRGVMPEKLLESKLWWEGPEFLSKPKAEWPTIKAAFKTDPAEERNIRTVLTAIEESEHFIDKIKHGNSFVTLQRIVAYILRFKNGLNGIKTDKQRTKITNINSVILTPTDLQQATTTIIKYIQESSFSSEMELIKNGKGIKTKFANLVPIIDEHSVLRVGGRLKAADIPFEQKHPALLPKNHHLTKLLMEHIHVKNKHVGAQALLAIVRQKYWPENGKRLAQAIVRNCVLCVRSKPIVMQQLMGNLPAERVNVARAFVFTGLDFLGPITIHYKIRGKKPAKAYACVFVCFVTKAVHIEPASDLTIDSFIQCLKRFIARRGLPKMISCDNATNHRGVYNQLTELTEILHNEDNQQKIIRYCQDNQIKWKFSPPRSPHFNGLHEAAVKSAKWHLRKVLHSMEVTYEELSTILTEIEAILNSRPLTPMSHDPNDLQPLTAGHFLIGAPLNSIEDNGVPYTSKTKTWYKIVELRNEFWKRWSKEYMAELQCRAKWLSEADNVKIGTLVIIQEDDVRPLQWRMGRVVKVYYDDNGKARVVDLHTSTTDISKAVDKKTGKFNVEKIQTKIKILKRAIHRICPLPIEKVDNPNLNSKDSFQEKFGKTQQTVKMNTIPEEAKKESKAAKTVKITKDVVDTDLKPIASRTRSKKLKASSHILVMVLALLAVIAGAFGENCNYTTFNHNPGLYFESLGKMSLVNDKWNIIGVVKMDQYWNQIGAIGTLLDRLDTLCKDLQPMNFCNVTRKQLRQQMNTINIKNDLLRGFSHKFLTRKRRGWSTSKERSTMLVGNANNIENSDEQNMVIKQSVKEFVISYLLKIRKSIDNVLQDKVLTRVKRGWANILGNGLKVATGVMDDDDAKQIQEQVNQLNNSYLYEMQLISNQTTIQDMTRNIIRKDEQNVAKQLAMLEQEIDTLKSNASISLHEMFNIMSLQTLALINTHREVQACLIQMVSNIQGGKVSPTILPPPQLKQHLIKIASKISKELMVPGSDSLDNLARIYGILDAKIHVNTNNIIIKITIPLLHREYFDIYHIIPVPFEQRQTKAMVMIETPQQYISMNQRQDRYYMMSIEEKAACKAFKEDLLICGQDHMVYNMQDNMVKCEMAIFTHPAKAIPPKCPLINLNTTSVWQKMHARNNYLFAVSEQTTFNIICETGGSVCKASGSGIISLEKNCMLQTKNMEIMAENIYESDLPIIVVPEINATDIINETTSIKSIKRMELQIKDSDQDMNELEEAIKMQMANERIIPALTWHDIHHYTVFYLLIGIILICMIVYIINSKTHKNHKNHNVIASKPHNGIQSTHEKQGGAVSFQISE